jgi:hypothetical protein
MTEEEWLFSDDPRKMLAFIGGETSERKVRLFACACSRRVWSLFKDERNRKAVEVAECHADARVGVSELRAAAASAGGFSWGDPGGVAMFSAFASASQAAELVIRHLSPAADSYKDDQYVRAARKLVAPLLRDIRGNPFRAHSLQLTCLTPSVSALATAAYQERHLPSGRLDSALLAILADALEDAGCTEAAILEHLRGPGPHARGCWPVDLCLGLT